MKKIITSVAVAILITFCLPACKKSSETQPPQTTLQKIQAKWQLQTWLDNDHYSGVDHITNSTGGANDYLDFRTDGIVYFSLFGSKYTATYALSGDTKIVFGGTDTYDIKTLTSTSFIIYSKETFGGTDYEEQTFTMKK